ncbi:hypothetical protein GCM10028774_20230 [Spirosoma jeollabukense]
MYMFPHQKRILILFSSLLALVWSCNKPKDLAPPQLTTKDNVGQLSFNSSTYQTFVVQNSGEGTLTWSATANKDWITISPTSGTNETAIEVSVDKKGIESGNQTGLITITSNGGQRTIQVTMSVGSPVVSISPTALDFGQSSTQNQLNVVNKGEGILRWSATTNKSWITLSGQNDPTAPNFSVSVNRSGLTAGTYTGNVTVSSNGGTVDVPVTMQVTAAPAVLGLSPTSLDFGTTATQLTVSVSNQGAQPLNWTAASNNNWLTVSPGSGTNAGTVTVNVNRTGITSGSYAGSFTINSNGGSTTVPVTMSIPTATSQPKLSVSTTSVSLGSTSTQGTLTVSNTGTGTLTWTVSRDQSWISVSPASGSNGGTITITGSRMGLAAGTYTGYVTVSSNGGSADITVTMVVPAATNTVTIVWENQLINDVNVSVNGTVVGSVPAGSSAQKVYTNLSSLIVGFTNVEGQNNGGEAMAGIYQTVTNPTGTITYTIDNVVGTQTYFAPVITNNSSTRLLIGVNMGLTAEKRTNRVAVGGTSNIQFGYFRYYTNANVRGYKDGSGYTGQYVVWNAGNQFSVTTRGSGRVNLTNSTNLRIGATETTNGQKTGDTYRTGTMTVQTDNTHNDQERFWDAPADFFIPAKPIISDK